MGSRKESQGRELMATEQEQLDYLYKRVESKYAVRIVYNLFNFPVTNFLMFFEHEKLTIPEYQRDLVWDQEKKEMLIESLMMNMPIGNIFLNERGYGDYELVDGQQRLDAIWSFYNNKFTWEGLFYKELPRKFKSRFDMGIVATYITKYKDKKKLIELYYRINWAGVPHSIDELQAIDDYRNEICVCGFPKKQHKKNLKNDACKKFDSKIKACGCGTIMEEWNIEDQKSYYCKNCDNEMIRNDDGTWDVIS